MDNRERLLTKIEKALSFGLGTHTVNDVFDLIKSGQMQIFYTEESAVVTEIKQAPRKKYMCIFLVAGKLDGLKRLQYEVIQFAKDQGCDFISGGGRLGWSKVATEGWKKRWVLHTYDL